jgi:hypothetical protein
MTKKQPSKPVLIEVADPSKMDKLTLRPYSDQELAITPELQAKLDKLMEFFDSTGINYDKFDFNSIPKLKLDKKDAYPNNDHYMHVPGQHDTQKWLEAVKKVYTAEKNGENRVNAIRHATSTWNVMETFDFLNWLKFYEEGAHMKYKFAQLWYENGAPGYFLHVKKDPIKDETNEVAGKDVDAARDEIAEQMTAAEKKQIIEKQRQKIVGRLDSAEKLLRTEDGQLFAGKELESLIEAIYSLKKKVQEEPQTQDNKVPVPAPPAPPAQPSGAPGNLPASPPGVSSKPGEGKNNTPKGIEKFLDNLETGKVTTNDDHSVEDKLEVVDFQDELVVEAQEIPAPPGGTPTPKPVIPKPTPSKEETLEVTEKDILKAPPTSGTAISEFNSKIDAVLANVTVADVVAELESLAKIFKTREIPRRLGIVDMMLDSLGLATYFPSLSEATNKALESNNYISTRVEDILSKLRGSMKTKEIDLDGGSDKETSPEVASIKSNLQEAEEKEKARKQMRKDQEAAELTEKTKETPDVEIEEDLATPPPPAAKPAAPPAV